jgi:hypothetical protein
MLENFKRNGGTLTITDTTRQPKLHDDGSEKHLAHFNNKKVMSDNLTANKVGKFTFDPEYEQSYPKGVIPKL